MSTSASRSYFVVLAGGKVVTEIKEYPDGSLAAVGPELTTSDIESDDDGAIDELRVAVASDLAALGVAAYV